MAAALFAESVGVTGRVGALSRGCVVERGMTTVGVMVGVVEAAAVKWLFGASSLKVMSAMMADRPNRLSSVTTSDPERQHSRFD